MSNKYNFYDQVPDFIREVAEECLQKYDEFLHEWLPGGKLIGNEYVCASIKGGEGKSCKINITNGKWADFATEDRGGDIVSLYASINGLNQLESAQILAEKLNLTHEFMRKNPNFTAPKKQGSPTSDEKKIIPIPPTINHPQMGQPSSQWMYHDIHGNLTCITCRFDLPEGKTIRPFYFNGKTWTWKAMPEPRPLYGLSNILSSKEKKILIVEGEKTCEAAKRLLKDNYIATTWQGGCNALNKSDWKPLENRDILIWPDADPPGINASEKLARLLKTVKPKSIKIINPPKDKAPGWDLADAENEKWNRNDIIRYMESNSYSISNAPKKTNSKDKDTPKKRQSAILVELAKDVYTFESDGDETIYASFFLNDHFENWPIRSNKFKMWLSGKFYFDQGLPPSNQALADAILTIEAKTLFNEQKEKVYTRVTRTENSLYIDLCCKRWSAVEITPRGWKIIDNPPVKFRRSKGMLPLPAPVRGGNLLDLSEVMNISGDQFILAMGWLLGTFNPHGPFPILVLQGEQGTGKSTQSRILRSLIDPSFAPLRTYPRSDRDLIIAANNSWVISYDNLSNIPWWIQDALCRLSTGGGFSCRQLYTNDDEAIFNTMRPIIINGIDQVAQRHDLIDRSIICKLDPIPSGMRRTEKEIMQTFQKIQPSIFGVICDALSTILAEEKNIKINELPRMADFIHWVIASESALPWDSGRFYKAFQEHKDEEIHDAVESDLVAHAIFLFIKEHKEWTGTPTLLLNKLTHHVPATTANSKSWPKIANTLSKRISRAQTYLRKSGIQIETYRNNKERIFNIRYLNN